MYVCCIEKSELAAKLYIYAAMGIPHMDTIEKVRTKTLSLSKESWNLLHRAAIIDKYVVSPPAYHV